MRKTFHINDLIGLLIAHTCMFPISNENKTNPKMAMKIAKAISMT